MNMFGILGIVTAVTSFGIAIFLLNRSRDNAQANILARVAIASGVWGVASSVFSRIPKGAYDLALFWWQIAYFAGIFGVVFYVHFIVSYFNLGKKKFVFFTYLLGCIFYFFTWYDKSRLFLGNLRFAFNQFYWADWVEYKNPLYTIFYITFYWILLGYCLLILSRAYKHATGIARNRLRYFILGSIVGWIGVGSMYAPTFRIDVYPYLNFLIAFYPLIYTYAIIRHQLMEIEVVIKKTLVFTGLLASVLGILILPTLFIQEYITRGASFGGKLIGLTISGIMIILFMRHIETFLINITDKYLFQKKYDYKRLLKTFTADVLTVLELDKLVNLTVDKLVDIIKIKSCAVSLYDDKNQLKVVASYKMNDPLDKRNAELTMPITIHNDVIGILSLGKKKSDEDYTQDDLDILLPLARTLAIAISNAELFVELGKTQAEAAQKEKMAVIGTLAAGMAHEIRNPVTTIKIFSEYLPEKIRDYEFREKYKNIVINEVDRIDHAIQALIDFSAVEQNVHAEAVSINDAIDEMLLLVGRESKIFDRISFVKRLPPDLPRIKFNKKDFEEVLFNLTQNAIHAIKGKGNITFEASEKEDSVELQIIDTGCGMSEDILKNIFNPFFTTRPKGFGLGLFVVNELIKRNNSKISVRSDIGRGATFNLMVRKFKY